MAIDREKVLQSASKFAEKKRYDKAIAELQRIIQEDPRDTRTLLKIGDYQVKMEAYQAAIETYERVGGLYVQQGFAVKAVAVYKQVRDIIARHFPQGEERFAHILPKLAEIHQQMGMKSDAISAYDEYAARLIKAGREKDALGVFRKIVEIDPRNPVAHLRLAEALARVKDLEGAIAQFSTAANLLMELGRRDDALKVVERLMQIRPEPAFAKFAAQILLDRGQPNDGRMALAKLQIAFQANNKDPETLRLLANAFDAIDQRPKAIEVLKALARLASDLGDQATFTETVQYLMEVASDDPDVRALYRGGPSVAPAPPPPPPPREESVVSVASGDISLEELDSIESMAAEEAPFELRQSRSYRPPPGAPSGVIVSASIEAAEDLHEPPSGGLAPDAVAAQALVNATAFRQARLPHKAVEVLRIAIEVLPASADLRVALRDALLEAGDSEGAVGEMITLAAILIELGETGAATLELQEVLELVPGHRRATELLDQLGYGGLEIADDQTDLGYEGGQTAFDAYDPGNPLPTYDLEDVGAIDVLSASGGRPAFSPLEDTDDPFDLGPPRARLPSASVPDALPSFRIDEEDSPFDEAPAAPLEVVPGAHSQPHAVNANVRDLRAFQGGDSLEDALEEIDFFLGRGLFGDARSIVDEQLSRAPTHPLLLEKLREIEEGEAAAGDPLDQPAPSLLLSADGDLGDALDALDDAFEPVQEARPQMQGVDDQVDVEAVFAKFKEGVKSQVEEGDSQTHYDLGVAYKEMGLVDDAIGEFRTAGRDPKRTCVCLSMVGVIEMERGHLDQAIAAFHEALAAKQRTVEQELSLLYEVAAIHEAKGEPDHAVHFFRKVQATDPGFRDVAERHAALGAGDDPRSRDLDDAGDFDAVFDDILGGQTLPGVSGVAKKRLPRRERAGHPALEREGHQRRVRARDLLRRQIVDRARPAPAARDLVEDLGEPRERAIPRVGLVRHEQRRARRRRLEGPRVVLRHAGVDGEERAHVERRRRHRAREPAVGVAARARVPDDDDARQIDARVPAQADDRALDEAIEIEPRPQRDRGLRRDDRRRRRDDQRRERAALHQLGHDDANVWFVWFPAGPVEPHVRGVDAVEEHEERARHRRRAARLAGDEEPRDVRLRRVAGVARVVDDVDRLAPREDRHLRRGGARERRGERRHDGRDARAHSSIAPRAAISSAAVERSSIAAARSPERYARRPIAATRASELFTRDAASSAVRSGCFSSVSRSSSTSNSSFFARAPSVTAPRYRGARRGSTWRGPVSSSGGRDEPGPRRARSSSPRSVTGYDSL
ncbi:MAG: tetratricopeptide repeat protein [Polyangiaceae bacterium]|nr:tetratricopeptide repeat protein [Polyangiaceae bacterium]